MFGPDIATVYANWHIGKYYQKYYVIGGNILYLKLSLRWLLSYIVCSWRAVGDVECGVVRLADHRSAGESVSVAVGYHDRFAPLDRFFRPLFSALVV